MQKKHYVIFLLLFFCTFLLAETVEHCQIIGDKNGFAVAIKWQNKLYWATPSHLLLVNNPPVIKYQGKNYVVSAYYLSRFRDFALLEASELSLKEIPMALKIEETSLPAETKNFYFEFDLANSILNNVVNLKGQSGKFIDYNGKIGLFQGYIINKKNNSRIFQAITLKIFPEELQQVEFQAVKEEFVQRVIQNRL